MAQRFDATLKDLVERYPRDWIAQLDITTSARVEVVDAQIPEHRNGRPARRNRTADPFT